MPTYQFYCKKCKTEFEDLCSWEDKNKVRCAKCKKKVEQVFSAPTVVFKEVKGTSKEDNFEYVAKWNMEQNQNLRRLAEKTNKLGKVYKDIDDSKYDGKIV